MSIFSRLLRSPAETNSEKHYFRTDIQGLRAVAVLAVVAYHARVPFAEGGFVGVDVFFVLSGFLITELMLRDRDEPMRAQLGGFYARRARRIVPAASVVLVATLVMSVARDNPLVQIRTAREVVAASLFFSNVLFTQAAGALALTRESPIVHYWSLAVEEQFYLIWPLVFVSIVLLAKRFQRQALAATIVAASAASFALGWIWLHQPTDGVLNAARSYTLLPGRAWQLGVGALLAVLSPATGSLSIPVRRVMQWLGLVGVVAAVALYDGATLYPGFAALLPTLATALLLAAGIAGPVGGVVDRALSSGVMQLVGRYSYSLYLWHLPLGFYVVRPYLRQWPARFAVDLAISLVAAAVTYHLVEQPVRNVRALRVRAPALSVAVGVAGAAAVVLVAVAVAQRGEAIVTDAPRAEATTATSNALDPAAAPTQVPVRLRRLLPDIKDKHYEPRRISANQTLHSTGRSPIALIGDSHAEHLFPAMDSASQILDEAVVAQTLRNCPLFAAAKGKLASVCETWKRDVLADLRKARPSMILISVSGAADFASEPTSDRLGYLRGLQDIAPTAVVGFTPVQSRDVPGCLATHLETATTCDGVWPTDANANLARAVTEAGMTFVDLRPIMCVDIRCPAINGNEIVWSDAEHLTAGFSARLGPFFATQLRALQPR